MTALEPVHSGKVRDTYAAGGDRLLMVASDRISAFDVVMVEPVPDKGRVLTALTAFWLEGAAAIAPNHAVSFDPADFPPGWESLGDLRGRAMVVRRAQMLPIECIVRAYVAGSAWKEYRASGTMHGQALPPGLAEADRLPEPVFTASTKATEGHDENITLAAAAELVGAEALERAREICIEVFTRASELAAEAGILLADTKFELGYIDGELALCDEVLTPDSSRFWEAEAWSPGTTPVSYDKQPVRDWLEGTDWDKQPPPPFLPYEVVRATRDRYLTAYERITGRRLEDWQPGR